jgi:hypothetical protein
VIGPTFAGALAGLIAEEDGRRLFAQAASCRRREPTLGAACIVQLAVRWEPVRAATMRTNELAGRSCGPSRGRWKSPVAHREPRSTVGCALEAAVSDPGAWPIGILGFLVRGGLVVLALPIRTLPSPVGVGTILGRRSRRAIEGPLRSLLIVATTAFAVIVAVAVLLAAVAQSLLHERWGSRAGPRDVRRSVGWRPARSLP